MRRLLIFLILIFPLFSFSAGEVVVQVEKTWVLSAQEPITDVVLNGTFLLVNPFQEITQMNITEGAELTESNGSVRVIFKSEEFFGTKEIAATALVRAAYPLEVTSNAPFTQGVLSPTALTQYNHSISDVAASLAAGRDTELEVVASLADWTHEYIEYDLAYWGDPAPASAVFQNPRAVCVGYTHLFIAMVRSLGFETRFVSGYAYAEDWQSHAWAEVKVGDAWLPVDPTFREVGALDARHIASSYSADQSGVYDSLTARGNGFTFNSTVTVRTSEKKTFPETLFIHTVLYEDDLKVVVYNPTDYYVTPTYELALPSYFLPEDRQILTIPPQDSLTLNYHVNTGELEPGYTHNIPYRASVQGTTITDEFTIVKGSLADAEPDSEYQIPMDESEPCPLITTFVVLLLAGLFSRKN